MSSISYYPMNAVATNELNLFMSSNVEIRPDIAKQGISFPPLDDVGIQFLTANEINQMLEFDLFSVIQKIIYSNICLSLSTDEHLLLLVSQVIREAIDELMTSHLHTKMSLSSQLIQKSAVSLQDTFTSILESSENIMSHSIVDTSDSNSQQNSFRDHAEFLLNIIISIEIYVQFVHVSSSYSAHLKNFSLKSVGHFVHKMFYLWCFDQRMTLCSNDVVIGCGNVVLSKVFPEFDCVNTGKLASCRTLSDVLLGSSNKARQEHVFQNSEKSTTTKLLTFNYLFSLLKYQQFGLVRHFSSFLMAIARFSMQHITLKNDEVFDCNRYWMYRLRLLCAVCSYLEAIRRSEISSTYQFHSQLRKIIEELIYCMTFISNHSQFQINPTFIIWHCVSRLERLESSSILSASLNCSKNSYFQNQKLSNLSHECNILDELKLVEVNFCNQVSSGLNLRMAYNSIHRIIKWHTCIEWSDKSVVLPNLQK